MAPEVLSRKEYDGKVGEIFPKKKMFYLGIRMISFCYRAMAYLRGIRDWISTGPLLISGSHGQSSTIYRLQMFGPVE